MNHDAPAYGLWSLVMINAAVFILFACSFFKPCAAILMSASTVIVAVNAQLLRSARL